MPSHARAHARSPADASSQAALEKLEEEAAKESANEEKRQQEEVARKKQQEEAARTKQQQEDAKKRAAEEAAKKLEQEVRGCASLAVALGSARSPTAASALSAAETGRIPSARHRRTCVRFCVACLLPLIALSTARSALGLGSELPSSAPIRRRLQRSCDSQTKQ